MTAALTSVPHAPKRAIVPDRCGTAERLVTEDVERPVRRNDVLVGIHAKPPEAPVLVPTA